MKNIFVLLLLLPLFIACSSDNGDDLQDYTSFVVTNNSDIDLPNCVVGYQKDGLWIKVAELGNLNQGQSSKEVILEKFIWEDVYVFTDYLTPRRLDVAFSLKENNKNILKFPSDTKGVVVTNKKDPSQYPQ